MNAFWYALCSKKNSRIAYAHTIIKGLACTRYALIVDLKIWRESADCLCGRLKPTKLCSMLCSHDKRVRKPQHVIGHTILRNATRRDSLCGNDNQWVVHKLPYTECSEIIIVLRSIPPVPRLISNFLTHLFRKTIIFKLKKMFKFFTNYKTQFTENFADSH